MYALRGAGQNGAPSFKFKTSPICVNEVKYLKQVFVCVPRVVHMFKESLMYLQDVVFIQGHSTSIFGKYLFGRRFEI